MRSRPKLWPALLVGVALSVGAAPSTAAPTSSKLADAAQKVFDDALIRYRAGQGTADDVVFWSERVFDADKSSSGLAARARTIDAEIQAKVASGAAAKHDALVAAYHLAEADTRR